MPAKVFQSALVSYLAWLPLLGAAQPPASVGKRCLEAGPVAATLLCIYLARVAGRARRVGGEV